jgi:hypothetical protein
MFYWQLGFKVADEYIQTKFKYTSGTNRKCSLRLK